jgi:signal transduction histidine kinase
VSHDLKTPLVTIKGFVGLLTSNLQKGRIEEVAKNLATITKSADRMSLLLDQLLELSKIGRIRDEWRSESVNIVLGDVLSGFNIDSSIRLVIQPDMPELCGDKTRMRELLQNLIENAVKYIGSRDDPIIEISAWVEDNKTVCCVKDNGIGIEMEYVEKIFGLFDKLDSTTPGSGIGLAVAKRIAEVHHGSIWCESEGLDAGSSFYFSIPRQSKYSSS